MGKTHYSNECPGNDIKPSDGDAPAFVGWLVGFYGISIFVGYLTPNPFYVNNQFYLKQFSLARLHSLIVKNISISNCPVYSSSYI